MGCNTATLKTFLPARTRKCYYRIHTSIPPNPQTHIPPRGMHVVVVGRVQAPPPWDHPPPPATDSVEMLRRLCATIGAFAPPKFGYDTSSRAREQVHDRGTTCRARVRD